jgi:hypothetical protein
LILDISSKGYLFSELIAYDNKIWIFSGFNSPTDFEDIKIYTYDPTTNFINSIPATSIDPLPSNMGHATVLFEDYFYLYGYTDKNSGQCGISIGDLYRLDPVNYIWTILTIKNELSKPTPRIWSTLVSIDNNFFLFGGISNICEKSPFYEVWSFKIQYMYWKPISTIGDVPDSQFITKLSKDSDSVFFGAGPSYYSSGGFTALFSFNSTTYGWSKLQNGLPGSLEDSCVAEAILVDQDEYRNGWFFFGGFDKESNSYSNDLSFQKISYEIPPSKDNNIYGILAIVFLLVAFVLLLLWKSWKRRKQSDILVFEESGKKMSLFSGFEVLVSSNQLQQSGMNEVPAESTNVINAEKPPIPISVELNQGSTSNLVSGSIESIEYNAGNPRLRLPPVPKKDKGIHLMTKKSKYATKFNTNPIFDSISEMEESTQNLDEAFLMDREITSTNPTFEISKDIINKKILVERLV